MSTEDMVLDIGEGGAKDVGKILILRWMRHHLRPRRVDLPPFP
ncbi:MAG: hypothetical protein V4709_15265 [Pseudomonadota bacterium]